MFTINYNSTTGAIVSYQGGADASDNVCPDGCSSAFFANDIPGLFDDNQNLLMTFDPVNKTLVLKNPIVIPAPISVAE